MKEELAKTTFAALDRQKGIPEPPETVAEEYPLPAWYRAVRETTLNRLSLEDISKALRQRIHPEVVVPLALHLLTSNPLAGELYDGELLASFKGVTPDYWPAHSRDAATLVEVVERLVQDSELDDDIRRDADELRARAKRAFEG